MNNFKEYQPTLECIECGYTLHGDMPSIIITCDDCIQENDTYFKEKAVEAYPDGWTCVECGDEYSERTTDAEDFYVIITNEGTLCKKCNQRRKRL